MRVAAGITAALVATFTVATHAEEAQEPRLRFPDKVTTIDGEQLDLARIARTTTLVVVTLKAHWCTVCQRQLVRIKARSEELTACGVSFVVLAPGPRDELEAVRDRTGFDYPFVEDDGLAIAESLGLRLSESEIQPAIVMLDRDLTVGWMQRGRNAAYFGDPALVEQVACWEKIPI